MPFILWLQRLVTPVIEQVRLEERIGELEKRMKELETRKPADPVPPLLIHHVNNLTVRKLEYSNNFECLEIKELSGRLNIGVTYSGFLSTKDLNSLVKNVLAPEGQAPLPAKNEGKPPRCTIGFKKQET